MEGKLEKNFIAKTKLKTNNINCFLLVNKVFLCFLSTPVYKFMKSH